MYCNSSPSSGLAGPIPVVAAPRCPRVVAPPVSTVPAAANATHNPTLLFLGAPDTGSMNHAGTDGGNNGNNCIVNNGHPSKVSFHDLRMEVSVVSLACLSDEMRNDIWYSQADIESMRSEARDLCRFVRVNPQAYPPEFTRGLELRISLERQCHKQLTVQGVVEAQRRYADPCILANLAQRCSMVPREIALAQAQHDFCTVYAGSSNDGVNYQQAAAATSLPPCQVPFMADPNIQTMASYSGPPPGEVDMNAKMPAVPNPNYICSQLQPDNDNDEGQSDCNMNDNNLAMASFLHFCPQDAGYPIAATMEQQHACDHHFPMNDEQQQQFSMDSLFEPLPLGVDTSAATLTLDHTMDLLDAVGDSNTKRSSFEMLDDPHARIVRPRLGGYPAM